MKKINKVLTTLKGFTSTINRYPITIMLFLFSAILTSYNIIISDFDNYIELLLSFILGAAVFMVLQMVFERFYQEKSTRLIFGGLAVLGSILYYLAVEVVVKSFNTDHVIRTIVLFFILFIAFIWVPSIKAKIGWNESFMAVFKAFFTVALYSGVLFLGSALIIMAIDMLIVDVGGDAFAHVGSIIAFIYAPIHFLSLIPIYPTHLGKISSKNSDGQDTNDNISNAVSEDDLTQRLDKAVEPSKFLDGLISHIIIPITAIFTVILLLYIVMNITGDFWKDNLMEPLLVTYSITVIIVYLLASVIRSKAATYFKRIFPKVLIPVVLFQTISSILKIGELGITSGRYYVIMFGIFASISAIIFSIRPNHKNNIIAPILIILSFVSIIPPVDAFTISKNNQINRLTNVLEENDMLKDDKIVPNSDVSEEDRQIIINSVRYLNRMDYLEDINWLKSYSVSYNFESTFGFPQYGELVKDPEVYRLYLSERTPIDVSDYDFFVEAELLGKDHGEPFKTTPWGDNGYTLVQEYNNGIGDVIIRDEQQNELIRYSLNEIFDNFKDREVSNGEMSMDEAEFVVENERAVLYIVVQYLNLEVWENSEYQNIMAYIMVKIK